MAELLKVSVFDVSGGIAGPLWPTSCRPLNGEGMTAPLRWATWGAMRRRLEPASLLCYAVDMVATARITTAEQLSQASDLGRCELVRGSLL